MIQHRTKEPHELRREAILDGREVTSRPNCAAVDWKSVALASGFLSRVRTSIRNKLTAVNFRRRWITPVARPSSSASGPRTFCIVAATLPTISIGKLFFQHETHCNT